MKKKWYMNDLLFGIMIGLYFGVMVGYIVTIILMGVLA